MTRHRALHAAKAILGPHAAVRRTPKGGRIGAHGEYLPWHVVTTHPTDSPTQGRYRCARCSRADVEGDDLILREVWHRAGGPQTAYKIGRIDLGYFFATMVEAQSFEACLAQLRPAQRGAA